MPIQALPNTMSMSGDIMMEENTHPTKMEFDQMDNKIVAATIKAFESGSLTPLIKEELRCTIQSRRLAEGKHEMKVEFKTPVRRKEMTDDERNRSVKRRQQNREAAQRFRQKQKDTSDYLSAKIKRLQSSSKALIDNLKSLKEEKDLLAQMLENHLLICASPNALTLTHTNSPHSHQNSDHIDSSYLNSFISTSSSVTDCPSIIASTPNTAASDSSSVFFTEDDQNPNFLNLESAVIVPKFDCDYDTGEQVIVCDGHDGQFLEVGYEETVVNIDDTDSEFDEHRPDSCSSSDAYVCKADWNCLSQSMHSMASIYTRNHLDSCSSQTFEPMPDDFFFMQDPSP